MTLTPLTYRVSYHVHVRRPLEEILVSNNILQRTYVCLQ